MDMKETLPVNFYVVRMSHNRLLCSDLRDIRKISKQLPKGVMLITGDNCLRMSEKLLKRIKNYLGENPHPIWAGLQWISHVVCTVFIFYSTRTLLWGLYFAHSFYLIIWLSCVGRSFHFHCVIYMCVLWWWVDLFSMCHLNFSFNHGAGFLS